MLTAVTTLIGLLGGILPYVVRIMELRQRYKYELELAKIQLEAARLGFDLEYSINNAKADLAEGNSLRTHDLYLDDSKFFNTLRASIRPILTYFFFFLFCAVKFSAMALMFKQGYNGLEVLNAVWDIYTVSIFSAIIAFWFGNRAMSKITENYILNDSSNKSFLLKRKN